MSAHLPTLLSLRLSDRRLARLTTAVFYQDIVLTTPQRARRLLELAEEPSIRVLIENSTCSIVFGQTGRSGVVQDGKWAAEVLARLHTPKLKMVTFRHLKVRQATFWTLTSRPTPLLACSHRRSLTIPASCTLDLTRLDCWTVHLGPEVKFELPKLVQLNLVDLEVDTSPPLSYSHLLRPSALPCLTSLRLCFRRSLVAAVRGTVPDRHAAVCQLAPQLERLNLNDEGAWIDPQDARLWTLLSRLRSLKVVEPYVADHSTGTLASTALRHLGRSLSSLNLPDTGLMFGVTGRNILDAFAQNLPSVQNLKELHLPNTDDFKPAPGMTNFYQHLVHEKLVAVAEARGAGVYR